MHVLIYMQYTCMTPGNVMFPAYRKIYIYLGIYAIYTLHTYRTSTENVLLPA